MTESTVTRIYRPLHELKYVYESHSKPTTVQASVSTKLPSIKGKSRQDNEHATQTVLYTNTIKDTLKMKMECGHVYDQISLIDRHMKEERTKYEEARSKHERFTKAFHQFLSCQYERVKTLLAELADRERASDEARATLEHLQRVGTETSLKVYELERRWREQKTSQTFLLYLASLLKHEISPKERQTFRVDPPCDTPSLNELIDNFERHARSDHPFAEADFEHVTAERVFAYLSAARKQNLRLLDLKLRYERTKEEAEAEKRSLEREYEERAAKMASEIEEAEREIAETGTQIERTKMELEELAPSECESKKLDEIRANVEALYKRCFGTTSVRGSHLQMLKCVEQHCVTLLSKLDSFDPQTLQKVI